MIYLTSDLHLNHDREFIWRARGFDSIYKMNDTIINNWNSTVNTEDEIYVLGDLILGDTEAGRKLLCGLKGNIHVILGNHDTNNRAEVYKNMYNIADVCYADKLNYKGYHFFLTHYPCFTGNLEHESLKKTTCNFFGHTHSKDKFFEDRPYMYNVALDAHECKLVLIDKAIEDMENKIKECKIFL